MKNKPTDLSVFERIGGQIVSAPNVERSLSAFPAPIPECWIWTGNQAMLFHHEGKSKRVVRTLIELACCERLHESWVPRRVSTCRNKLCVNPTHHKLVAHNQNRYGIEGPLPARLQTSGETEIEEIQSLLDEWHHPTRDEFLAKCASCHFSFSEAAVANAFQHYSADAS